MKNYVVPCIKTPDSCGAAIVIYRQGYCTPANALATVTDVYATTVLKLPGGQINIFLGLSSLKILMLPVINKKTAGLVSRFSVVQASALLRGTPKALPVNTSWVGR